MSSLLDIMLLAMAAVWGTCPPAMRHAHEGGDETHSHHVGIHQHHHPCHAQKTGTVCPWGHDDSELEVSECGEHLHWALFGLNLTLPTNPNGQDPRSSSVVEPILVRLVDDSALAVAGESPQCAADLSGIFELVPGGVAVVAAPLRWVNSVAALPLCDSARLERSGVLLA